MLVCTQCGHPRNEHSDCVGCSHGWIAVTEAMQIFKDTACPCRINPGCTKWFVEDGKDSE